MAHTPQELACLYSGWLDIADRHHRVSNALLASVSAERNDFETSTVTITVDAEAWQALRDAAAAPGPMPPTEP